LKLTVPKKISKKKIEKKEEAPLKLLELLEIPKILPF